MVNNKYSKETKHILCLDDIDCKNKRCFKLHNERKRLNICKFDVFFVPYKDDGCHFEDCTHVHPKRNAFYIQKDKDFDNLIESVVNHLELDDTTSIIEDWKLLMRNIHGNNYDELYQELYNYCLNINHFSFQLEGLQFYEPKSYIYYLQNILSNIYDNHQKFDALLKSMVLQYDEKQDDYILLCNKLQEDIQFVSMYKHNAKKMLYHNYGITINF